MLFFISDNACKPHIRIPVTVHVRDGELNQFSPPKVQLLWQDTIKMDKKVLSTPCRHYCVYIGKCLVEAALHIPYTRDVVGGREGFIDQL